MIITLTGPTGVGKTDTSWALLELASPMVFLDCDWFAARNPFSWKAERDVESVYQALSAMLSYHIGHGATRFVIPLTLEMSQSYAHNRSYLERFGLPIFHFRLACGVGHLRERVLKRDRIPEQQLRELDVVPAQVQISEALPDMFIPIDVSTMDEKTVARTVLAVVSTMRQGAQQGAPADRPLAAPTAGG